MLRDPLFPGFFSMEPSESKRNTKGVVDGKPVKEIADQEPALSNSEPSSHKKLVIQTERTLAEYSPCDS